MSMTKIRVVAFGFLLMSMPAIAGSVLGTPVKLKGRKDPVSVASPCAGIVLVVGCEVKKIDQVPPEQLIAVEVGSKKKQYRRWKEGDRVKKGATAGTAK